MRLGEKSPRTIELMDEKPLVSVIVALWNAEDYIARCLESIIGQGYGDLEILVIDDGSTDRSAARVEKYRDRVRYFRQENSGGPAGPRNRGIRESSGEYICFCDNDDIMVERRVGMQVDFLQRHPEVGLVFCDYRNFNDSGPHSITHFQTCPELLSIIMGEKEKVVNKACRLLPKENFGICGTLMFRKKMLEYEAGFDESLIGVDDFHFYYRLARHSKVGIVNEVGQMRRLHGKNLSHDNSMMLEMAIRCRSMLRETEKDPLAASLLGKYVASCWSSLSRSDANHKRYARSLLGEVRALANDFSLSGVSRSFRNVARTSAIAIGLHDSDEISQRRKCWGKN